jgi:predicted component of viral defense system (DUF524 family)
MKAEKLLHRGAERIKIDFPYNQEIASELRKIPDCKWSQSHKVWHIPYTKDAFRMLKTLFPEIEFVKHEVQHFAKGKALLYRTAFICKFEKIDNYNTKLTVFAEDPIVVNGTDRLGPHGYIANVQKVAPTTIEEYSILLYIAEQLGDTTLPPINLPRGD